MYQHLHIQFVQQNEEHYLFQLLLHLDQHFSIKEIQQLMHHLIEQLNEEERDLIYLIKFHKLL